MSRASLLLTLLLASCVTNPRYANELSPTEKVALCLAGVVVIVFSIRAVTNLFKP